MRIDIIYLDCPSRQTPLFMSVKYNLILSYNTSDKIFRGHNLPKASSILRYSTIRRHFLTKILKILTLFNGCLTTALLLADLKSVSLGYINSLKSIEAGT